MKSLMKIIIFNISIFVIAIAYDDPVTETPINMVPYNSLKSANLSPEIIDEFKDFENLIPTATIDEIVAKHYVFDGNFRTAFAYLRSNEFTQLQRQLLTMPEIIQVLEFLHLTTVNATTMHMGATEAAASEATESATLDDYNDNRIDKMTTNMANTKAATTGSSSSINVASAGEATTKKLYKGPQFHTDRSNNNVDVNNAHAQAFIEEQQPLVRIVLLQDSEVKAKAYDAVFPLNVHNDKHITPSLSPSPQHRSLGSFTSFVEEVLQHLPNSQYQNMIKDKCMKNAKFAEFYKALRSPEFKPIVDEAMKKPNVIKIIKTLNSHDVDVHSLEPIAFKVISWGPKI